VSRISGGQEGGAGGKRGKEKGKGGSKLVNSTEAAVNDQLRGDSVPKGKKGGTDERDIIGWNCYSGRSRGRRNESSVFGYSY